MKAIWDDCEAAGIPVPEQVVSFFGGEPPDNAGIEIELPVRKWNGESEAGYELDVASIPRKSRSSASITAG